MVPQAHAQSNSELIMESQAFVPPESFDYPDSSNLWTGDPQLLSNSHTVLPSEYQQFDTSNSYTDDQYKNPSTEYAEMAQIMQQQQQPFRARPQEMYNTTFAYNTMARTRPAEPTEEPQAKRARFDDAPVERCYSQTGSQSTCCSSCSDGIVCTKPECDQEENKSCPECACDIPVCPCPDETAQNPRVQIDCPVIPVETRLQDWNNSVQSAWVPQPPRNSFQSKDGMSESTRIYNNYQPFGGFTYDSSHVSTAMTPSMVNNTSTTFSPNDTIQAPHIQQFGTNANTYNSPLTNLSGTGDHFQSSWNNSSMNTANDGLFDFSCGWDGCDAVLESNQQLLAHCLQTHVPPQMGFTCPIQPNTCPSNIGPDPLAHLKLDHGFDFDFLEQGITCPAPDCTLEHMLADPIMFQNHLEEAHAKPVGGSLRCEFQHCDTSFTDVNQFSHHLTHQHLENSKDIDSSQMSQTNRLPPIQALKIVALSSMSSSQERSSRELSNEETNQKPNQDVDQNVEKNSVSQQPPTEDDGHTCRWMASNQGSCGCTFESASKLQDHIVQDHLASLDKKTGYKCCWEGCRREAKRGNENSGFSQRGKLERHMATHTNYKCCTCTVCGKTFSAEQALLQHMNLHSNHKPWECKHCGKRFPQQSACTIHERTHTKEKPLKCEICGKAFSESSNLSKHRKTHGEKGAHTCNFPGCSKSFHRLDQLKRHKAMHTRAKSVVSEGETKTESEGD
ncbi:hypothetical protein HYFRA_00002731 [Hymenoscyphus fraxineus]|uniref:C2H2-type domain-containing protein n=1 Tax=Hymenoscyphus fraxineus TaxID=746836 RepID=A0A9N9PFK5_9HELO|nr:hypothetical protein HYFRA_00002731 [Hymenoscyphus fraxineus]